MAYFLGLDFGTSGARACVVDRSKTILAQAQVNFSINPQINYPSLWQDQLNHLLLEIPLEYRQKLTRMAIDGTSGTVLLCDAHGDVLLPPLLYNNSQAQAQAESLKPIAPPGHLVCSPTSSLAKLLWYQTQPEFAQARYLLHQADWLGFLVHGRLAWSDYHNALKLGYDPAQERYPAWFEHPKLQPLLPLLPQIVAPGTVIGPITPQAAHRWQISSDCQICAGTTDSMAAFLAAEIDALGAAVTSLGSTLVLKLISDHPIQASTYGIYSHRYRDLWLVGGASNCGGAILKQFFSTGEIETLSAQINPEEPSPYSYYPLTQAGERFPIADPHLQPQLSPRPSDPVAFLHGLLDSLARIEAQGYALLAQLGAPHVNRVYTAGGGAQNQAWTRIRQRVLGVPVQTSDHTDAAYGAALLALQGA